MPETTTHEDAVLAIMCDALNLKPGELTRESTRDSIEMWDSLGHLGVLAALDTHFDGKVGELKDIATADSVASIFALLREHGLL